MALLLCGHQRSGTTLLQKVCNSHPDITITMEFGNFLNLELSYRAYCVFFLKRWWNIKNEWGINPNYGFMKSGMLANFIFISRYLLHLFPSHSKPLGLQSHITALKSIFSSTLVGDKWPDYIFLLDQLVDSKLLNCLVIYRDCRDVTSSTLNMARTRWRNQPWVNTLDTPEKVARRWVSAIEIMEKNKDKIYTMRYENLVENPKKELQELGNWLKVDPSGFKLSLIKHHCLGKYKKGLTHEELKMVMEIAGPTMEKLGYL